MKDGRLAILESNFRSTRNSLWQPPSDERRTDCISRMTRIYGMRGLDQFRPKKVLRNKSETGFGGGGAGLANARRNSSRHSEARPLIPSRSTAITGQSWCHLIHLILTSVRHRHQRQSMAWVAGACYSQMAAGCRTRDNASDPPLSFLPPLRREASC